MPEPRPEVVRQRRAPRATRPASRWARTRRRPSAAPSSSRTRRRCCARRAGAGGGGPRASRCRTGRSRLERLRALRHLAHLEAAQRRDRPRPAARRRSSITTAAPPWRRRAASASSGTGSSWSRSPSSERPARGRKSARPQAGQASTPSLSSASVERRAAGRAARRGRPAGRPPRAPRAGAACPTLDQARLVLGEVVHAVERRPVVERRRAPFPLPVASGSGVPVTSTAPQRRPPRPSRAGRAPPPGAPSPPPARAWTTMPPQPLQLPSSRSRATPSSMSEQLHVAAVRLHVGPHLVERPAHPLLERHRVQPVDQQQAAHHAVVGQPLRARRRPAPRAAARGPRRAARATAAARSSASRRGARVRTRSSSAVSRWIRSVSSAARHRGPVPTRARWACASPS